MLENAFGGDAQDLTNSAANYTFNGSATGDIVVTVTKPSKATKAIYVKSVVVTYTPSGYGESVSKPVITGETEFVTSTTVTITCGTEGATIQYSLDNGSNWTTYSDPFTLTETKTVKAKATKSGLTDSDVASKDFTKITPSANIAAFVAADVHNYVTLTNALVTRKFANNTAYLEDASGAVMLYLCAADLATGDKINGVMKVTDYQVYNVQHSSQLPKLNLQTVLHHPLQHKLC